MTRSMLCMWIAAVTGAIPLAAQASDAAPLHSVVRLDSALNQIVAADAQFEMLKADYFGISEGPVWIQQGRTGYLLFSDIGANVIYKWSPDRTLAVFMEKSGLAGDPAHIGYEGFIASN